jgi:hypothetical protein
VVSLDSCVVVNFSACPVQGMTLPDKALSKQDGIRTSLARACPKGGAFTASSPGAFSYCQIPFRFCHSDRSNWGRGYSGHGLVPTLLVQSVSRGGTLGAYFAVCRA